MQSTKACLGKYIYQVCPKLMVNLSISSVIYKLVDLSANSDLLANQLTNWQITYFTGGL